MRKTMGLDKGQRRFVVETYKRVQSLAEVSRLFQTRYQETLSTSRLSEFLDYRGIPKAPKGGKRERLSQGRMEELLRESGGDYDKGINVGLAQVMTKKVPEEIVKRCEELGIPYYNTPTSKNRRENGNDPNHYHPDSANGPGRKVGRHSGNGHY